MHRVRPSIRAAESSLRRNPPAQWIAQLWTELLEKTGCVDPTGDDGYVLVETRNDPASLYQTRINVCRRFFDNLSPVRADARLDTSFGLVLYALAIVEETGFHRVQARIIGRLALRALVEVNITLKHLIAKDSEELWKSFRGWMVTGTWPMRTEHANRPRGIGANALASSVVLICRRREANAVTVTRRELLTALKSELPGALAHLQRSNIAPVDLVQAAIGPGMAVYTRFANVLDAEGNPLSVREALALINQILDEALTEQEGDFDADSRWALAWFEQHGFAEGEFGVAETLSKAKNTSVKGLEEAGILKQGRGKVRLLAPEELPVDWDSATDPRLTAWETVHHLVRVLDSGGESAAAELARELAYRLYTVCERKKRAAEALAYNGLVQSWPEVSRLARESEEDRDVPEQSTLL